MLLVFGGADEEQLGLKGLLFDEFQGLGDLPEVSLVDDLAVSPIYEGDFHFFPLDYI